MTFHPEPEPENLTAAPSPYAAESSGLTARERSLRRKWIYGISMIVLIVILFSLGVPSTLGTGEVKGQPGGVLAQYRDNNGLTQTELGQIDPTSETIRLATLGMRGIAVELMWIKANNYQMKKDWTRLRATLDQISKLQPHSILVWRYQAWNLSYNVSVAFDDYHDKFYWVIEGLNYMLQGVKANENEPRLYWDMAWFISNKIGRDDAAKYYRRLFTGERQPDGRDAPDCIKEFRERFSPPSDPARGISGGFPPGSDLTDNWHVGKAWFRAAEDRIDPTPKWPGGPPRNPVRGMATVIFYSDAPTCQLYYADNLEKDGHFGQVAKRGWREAEAEWHDLGELVIETSSNEKLQLNRREELFDSAEKKREELDRLAPGEKEKLEDEKRAQLSPEARDIWDKYRADLDKYNRERKSREGKKNEKPLVQPTLDISLRDRAEAKPDEIARRAPQAVRKRATELANSIHQDETLAMLIDRERSKVNFNFWRTRARAEQTPDCIAARKAIYDAEQSYLKGDLIRAGKGYEEGFRLWRKVLNDPEFNSLVDDVSLGGDLIDDIRRYRNCLDQDDEELPYPFVLQDVVDKHGNRQGAVSSDRPLRMTPPPAPARPAAAPNPVHGEKKANPAPSSAPAPKAKP
jgi:hypothetical protein